MTEKLGFPVAYEKSFEGPDVTGSRARIMNVSSTSASNAEDTSVKIIREKKLDHSDRAHVYRDKAETDVTKG